MADPTGKTLDELYAVIASRKGGDPANSYTAQLLAEGMPRIARKFGEEAVETLIEALKGDGERLAAESADLLYHLLVMWAAAGVTPDRVWRLLDERKAKSGLAEKASRRS
jgi:phosphoribosyl-ATP pyrophosphohydrolase